MSPLIARFEVCASVFSQPRFALLRGLVLRLNGRLIGVELLVQGLVYLTDQQFFLILIKPVLAFF
ncbi:Uncharacterised protein [Vibrio cholerae]|nr:Uncharacterised protein [Vibrio cholerae]